MNQLSMSLIDQHIAIPRLSCAHIQNSLVRGLQRSLLYPRPHGFLRGQLQHLFYLVRCTDGAPAYFAALCNQREGVESRQAVLWGADLDEGAVCAEKHEVLFKWHVGRGDCADDEIERAGVVGGPVFIVVRCNVFVGSNLLCVLLFRSGTAYGGDAVGSECLEQVSRFSAVDGASEGTFA